MEVFSRAECSPGLQPSCVLSLWGLVMMVMVMQPPRTCLATSLAHSTLLVTDRSAARQELAWALPFLCPPLVLPPGPAGAVPGCWVPWVPVPAQGGVMLMLLPIPPHPSAQLVLLTILSRPRVPPALPWPPAPSCSLGKRYGDSVPPWWDKRGGTWGWGTWSTLVLREGGADDAPFLGQLLLGDALGAEPPEDAVQPPSATASVRPSVCLGTGDRGDPRRAGAPWDRAAVGPRALGGGGIMSQACVTPGWAVCWWGLVLSPPRPRLVSKRMVTQTHQALSAC